MIIQESYDLSADNTFGIAATADCFISYDSVEELHRVLAYVQEKYAGVPVYQIGGGSNLLLLSDVKGVVLHSCIRTIEVEECGDDVFLRVGAGMVWDELVAYCVEHGYYGLENLSYIPGEVGGAAVQNIGAYGVEVKDVITHVETMDLHTGERATYTKDDCEYGYRKSRFKTEWKGRMIVTHACFRLSKTFVPHLDYGGVRASLEQRGVLPEEVNAFQLRDTIIAIRKEKLPDPKVQGNAGSFFMNPVVSRCLYSKIKQRYDSVPCYEVNANEVKIPAAWLIEQRGWKGRDMGRAGVHDRQALVLVNKGHATGHDVLRLCDAIIEDVKGAFGIELVPEVNFMGNKE